MNNTSKYNDLHDKTYYNTFIHTNQLPHTTIMHFLINNFRKYYKHLIKKKQQNEMPIYFEDCFDASNLFKNIKSTTKFSINLTINGKITLNKLIAYCYYNTAINLFKDNEDNPTSIDFVISNIKNQIGNDVSRDNRIINGKRNDSNLYSNYVNASLKTDAYSKDILNLLNNINNTYINYNTFNIILLLSCQNMYNFIFGLVTILFSKLIKLEDIIYFLRNPKKQTYITITKSKIIINLIINSNIITTENPDISCGKFKCNFIMNLLNNTFFFKSFSLNFNVSNCSENNDIETNNTMNNSKYLKYTGIIASLGTIVSIPFLLPLLGGKNDYKKKSVLTKRNRKNKYNKKHTLKKYKNDKF